MNVVFLDFDGVVNTPWWSRDESGDLKCKYNFPFDGKVNNWQAVQWVSEFCEKYNYDIVISSTWRKEGLKVCFENINELKTYLVKEYDVPFDKLSRPDIAELDHRKNQSNYTFNIT